MYVKMITEVVMSDSVAAVESDAICLLFRHMRDELASLRSVDEFRNWLWR